MIIDAGVHGNDGGGSGEEVGGHHRGRREVAVLNQVSWGEAEVRVRGEVRGKVKGEVKGAVKGEQHHPSPF